MGILFLFGAGASFGSGPCTPYNPPLGRKLISKMSEEGGIARTIDGELLEIFNDDPEKGMVEFFKVRNGDATQLLKQMAGYLSKFSIAEGNLYIELIRILRKRKSICLATTNYDFLIEQAICATGQYISYQSLSREKNNIPLLKIHGSPNFISKNRMNGITFNVPATSKGITNFDIDIVHNQQQVIDYCSSDTSLAPAIAMYHPQKTVLHGGGFVEKIKSDFKREVKKSSKIFVIGLSVNPNDIHIWGELEKTEANIYIVDLNSQQVTNWIDSITKKNIYHISDTFSNSLKTIKSILQI